MKSRIHFYILFSLVLILGGLFVNGGLIISSPNITIWGTWGNWDRCPQSTYAIGFQLKVEAPQGFNDDSGLNAIRLFCGMPGVSNTRTTITSSEGHLGSWRKIFFCQGLIIGFQMRVTPYRRFGITAFVDDTAANNLRGECLNSNGEIVPVEGDGEQWGDWTSSEKCVDNQAVCAMMTQVEQGTTHDYSGLNNVRMECCDLENTAASFLVPKKSVAVDFDSNYANSSLSTPEDKSAEKKEEKKMDGINYLKDTFINFTEKGKIKFKQLIVEGMQEGEILKDRAEEIREKDIKKFENFTSKAFNFTKDVYNEILRDVDVIKNKTEIAVDEAKETIVKGGQFVEHESSNVFNGVKYVFNVTKSNFLNYKSGLKVIVIVAFVIFLLYWVIKIFVPIQRCVSNCCPNSTSRQEK